MGRPRPSPRLTEIVDDRLSSLDPGGRRGLALPARGEPLSVSVVDSLAGDGVAAELERRQLATVTRDDRRVEVRLVHPI